MTFKDAMDRVLSGHKDCKVTSVMDLKGNFVVAIEPKDWKQDEILMDPFFVVDKQTGKVSEWTPIMDPEGFKQALAHGILYKEGDPIPEEKPDVLKHSEDLALNELYHHGIIGMKWGIRRFQPYRPGAKVKGGKEVGIATKVKQRVTGAVDGIKEHRAAKKKAAQVKKAQATRKANTDFQEAKRKAIESGSVDDLAKFKGKLSAEEYAYAFRRLDNERKLDQLVAANQPDPWEKVDKGFALVSRLAGYANTVSNAKESFDRLNKSKKDAAKEKKENAANDALTKVTNLDELNKVQKDHNLTPEQYAKGLQILGTKHQYEKMYGQDFWDTEARSRKEQEAKRKAEYDETRAKMDAEKAHKQSQKEARKAYKKDLNTPMDGEWSKAGEPKTNQLLLEMKDATPSKYGADKRSIKGAKPGTTSKARNTSALNFGDKTQLVKRGKPGESDVVRQMRNTVATTKKEAERQRELDKRLRR